MANYYLASRALGIELSFASFIFIVPIVATIAMLPISIGGIGIREKFTGTFHGRAWRIKRQGSGLFIAFICNAYICLGIVGGIVYVVRPFILKQKKISVDAQTADATPEGDNAQIENGNAAETEDKQ